MRLCLIGLALVLGCDRGPELPESSPEAPSPAPSVEPAEQAPERPPAPAEPSAVTQNQPTLGGVRWEAPEALHWRTPSSPMRNAEYFVGEGEAEAVMTVFHFPGMGGSIQDNVDRWVGQFEGVTANEENTETQTINGLEVTTIDVRGTFASSMPMAGQAGPQPNQRLLGAIVDGPEGPVFFKLLGPTPTVTSAEDAFAALVASLTGV